MASWFKGLTLRQKIQRVLGIIGVVVAAGIYITSPSFPTPDKILVFALLVGLAIGQMKQTFWLLAPFVGLLLIYESFRGLVPGLNHRVNYMWMPEVDRWLFGSLPTDTLQKWWWNGQIQWYDFIFYLPYMLHFVLPFTLAIIVWKTRESEYWRYITAFISISFVAFIIFWAFPAAPPWMSSNMGFIEPIDRISSSVWFSLGINDFPSVYNQITANPVAAVPSLHAAYATLFAMFVIMFYKFRLRWLVLIYPMLIYIGTVYQGEHYVIDEILGAVLGIAGYMWSPYIVKTINKIVRLVHASYEKNS